MMLRTIADLHKANDKVLDHIGEMKTIQEVKNYEWSLLSKTCKALSLIYSDFKCESCGNEKNLTLHHLVDRTNKDYVDVRKYLIQRHNYKNLAILCRDCHYQLNNVGKKVDDDFNNEMLSISDKTIEFARLMVINSTKESITGVK